NETVGDLRRFGRSWRESASKSSWDSLDSTESSIASGCSLPRDVGKLPEPDSRIGADDLTEGSQMAVAVDHQDPVGGRFDESRDAVVDPEISLKPERQQIGSSKLPEVAKRDVLHLEPECFRDRRIGVHAFERLEHGVRLQVIRLPLHAPGDAGLH